MNRFYMHHGMSHVQAENVIMRADARDMSGTIKPGSVRLTVTSPPYRNAIDYRADIDRRVPGDPQAGQPGRAGGSEWFRGSGLSTTSAYLDDMEAIFSQVLRATAEGGLCCIVIGDEVVDGKIISLHSLLASRLASSENAEEPDKWRLRDIIVWNKVTAGRNGSGNRFGTFIQNPHPGYFRVNIMHEYILVLQKGHAAPGRSGDAIPLNRIMKREIANSVWNIPPVPPGTVRHPAPFPEQIPWRLITLFTRPGDLVLDPMCGSGQTVKVARHMDRRYIGFDIMEEYVAEARERLAQMPALSDYLIPVFYKESWSKDVQAGFFETEAVDLSPNVPPGYKPAFCLLWRASIYAYYENARRYMCFIFDGSRQYRLSLGSLAESGSMLERAFGAIIDGGGHPGVKRAVGKSVAGCTRAAAACSGAIWWLAGAGDVINGAPHFTKIWSHDAKKQ